MNSRKESRRGYFRELQGLFELVTLVQTPTYFLSVDLLTDTDPEARKHYRIACHGNVENVKTRGLLVGPLRCKATHQSATGEKWVDY